MLQSQLVHSGGAELDKVRHVHLLDVTVEDELQWHVSERDWSRCGQAYLLVATHQLLHEEDGALLLRGQVDLGYRGSEQSHEEGEHADWPTYLQAIGMRTAGPCSSCASQGRGR